MKRILLIAILIGCINGINFLKFEEVHGLKTVQGFEIECSDYSDLKETVCNDLKSYQWDENAIYHLFNSNMNLMDVYEVGSESYNYLFKVSELSNEEKIELVPYHLGARFDNDNNLILHDTTENDLVSLKFTENLLPHSEFFTLYSNAVINYYSDEKIDDYTLLDRASVHQIRFYFDREVINNVRLMYEGETDLEKLLNYDSSYRRDIFDLNDKYHERTPKEGECSVNPKANDKYMSNNKLFEFIVDENNNFVTRWDVLNADGTINDSLSVDDKCKIINSESMNYGYKYNDLIFIVGSLFKNQDGNISSHQALDLVTNDFNSNYIRTIKKEFIV